MDDKSRAISNTVSAFSRSVGMIKRPSVKNDMGDRIATAAYSAFITSKQILKTLTQVLSIFNKYFFASNIPSQYISPLDKTAKPKKRKNSSNWIKNTLGLLTLAGLTASSLINPEVRENLGKYFTNFLEGLGLGKEFREQMLARLDSFKNKLNFLKNLFYTALGAAALIKVANVISLLYSLGKMIYLGFKLKQLGDIAEEYGDIPEGERRSGEGPRTGSQPPPKSPTTVIPPRPPALAAPKPPALPGIKALPQSEVAPGVLAKSGNPTTLSLIKDPKTGQYIAEDAVVKSSKPSVRPSVSGLRALGGAGAALGLIAGAFAIDDAIFKWKNGDKSGAVLDALSGIGSIVAGIGAVLLLLGVAAPVAGAALTAGSIAAIGAGVASLIKMANEGKYTEGEITDDNIDYWDAGQENPMQFNTVPPKTPKVVNDSKEVSLNTTLGNDNTTILAMTQPIIYVG